MRKNIGLLDKIIRFTTAITFMVLHTTGITTGIVGTILLILGGVFIATSIISVSPMYALLGVNTCAAKH